MAIEVLVKHVRKFLPVSDHGLFVLPPRERHAEIKVRRDSKRRRPSTCDRLVGPGAERIETPTREPGGRGGAPCVPAPVFARAGFRIGNAITALYVFLIEPHGIHSLRQKVAPGRVDQPENSVAFGYREIPALP